MPESALEKLDENSSPVTVNWLGRYLAEQNIPCPSCGYNLRGLKHPQCAECGSALKLSVQASEPPMGYWIATLVATMLPASFGVLVAISFLYALTDRHGRIMHASALQVWTISLAIVSVLAIPAVVVLLALRRRFVSWSNQTQRIFMVVPIAYDLLTILTLIIATNQ